MARLQTPSGQKVCTRSLNTGGSVSWRRPTGCCIAHIVKANDKEMRDDVQHWHVHDCTVQFVMVLNGGAATHTAHRERDRSRLRAGVAPGKTVMHPRSRVRPVPGQP